MEKSRKEITEKLSIQGLGYSLVLIGLIALLSLVGCNKESTCNCGIVQDDAIEYDATGNTYYTLTIKSDCSGNNKKVYVDYSSWLNTPVGDNTCINGVGNWMPLAPITNTLHPTNKNI
mgnify:FL=1